MKKVWFDRALSFIIILVFTISAGMKINSGDDFLMEMSRLGIPHHLIYTIALIEVIAAIIYAIPKTSLLGAIILTGYLGGAVMTHFRVGDGIATPILLGLLLWLGLYLREPQLQKFLPFRR